MSTSIRLPLGIAALALLLAACASTETALQPASHTVIGQDGAYVGAVKTIAKRRGVRVVWVNPPEKRQQIIAQAK
jgi:hypothetical protein